MSALQSTWGKAAAGGGVTLLLLALVEGSLRVLGVPDPGLYEGDLNTSWWLRANLDVEISGPEQSFQLTTNDLGLRGALPPTEGDWTLVLGCSTTLGWGVDGNDAWPAQLALLLDEPVINGGQPGWSTHQAVSYADTWLSLEPSRVILAYGVRDAQAAPRPDSSATPTPWWRKASLTRLIQGTRTGGAPPADQFGDPETARVPPDQYRENLKELIELSGEAEIILLAFPQTTSLAPWVEVQRELGTSLEPTLSRDAFFESDPVHLNVAGHTQLAEWLASQLGSS